MKLGLGHLLIIWQLEGFLPTLTLKVLEGIYNNEMSRILWKVLRISVDSSTVGAPRHLPQRHGQRKFPRSHVGGDSEREVSQWQIQELCGGRLRGGHLPVRAVRQLLQDPWWHRQTHAALCQVSLVLWRDWVDIWTSWHEPTINGVKVPGPWRRDKMWVWQIRETKWPALCLH